MAHTRTRRRAALAAVLTTASLAPAQPELPKRRELPPRTPRETTPAAPATPAPAPEAPPPQERREASQPDRRSPQRYTAPIITIEGHGSADASDLEGGYHVGDVVANTLGAAGSAGNAGNAGSAGGGQVSKHIANVRIAPIAFSASPDAFLQLLSSFGKSATEVTGSIAGGGSIPDRSFQGTLAAAELSALDGSSKEPARIHLEIQPTQLRWEKSAGDKPAAKLGSKQKALLASNFRLTLDGPGGPIPCERVARIDPISIRAAAAEQSVGITREPSKAAPRLEYSNLVFSVAASDIAPFLTWADEALVKGKSSSETERTATIALLDPSLKDEVFKVTGRGVGLISVSPESADASDAIKRFRVECYVESWEFSQAK
jgi:hypothetical protein